MADGRVFGAPGDGERGAAVPFMVHQAGVSTQAPGTCPEPLRRGLRAKTVAAATVMIMSNQCYYSRCRTLTIHRVPGTVLNRGQGVRFL